MDFVGSTENLIFDLQKISRIPHGCLFSMGSMVMVLAHAVLDFDSPVGTSDHSDGFEVAETSLRSLRIGKRNSRCCGRLWRRPVAKVLVMPLPPSAILQTAIGHQW